MQGISHESYIQDGTIWKGFSVRHNHDGAQVYGGLHNRDGPPRTHGEEWAHDDQYVLHDEVHKLSNDELAEVHILAPDDVHDVQHDGDLRDADMA